MNRGLAMCLLAGGTFLGAISCSDLSHEDPDALIGAWNVGGQSSSSLEDQSSSSVADSTGGHSSSSSPSSSSIEGCAAYSADTAFCDLRDFQVYKIMTIGSKVWMQQNLNYGTMVAGTSGQSDDAVVEKYCYGDTLDNCSGLNGGLYTWAEAMALPKTCNATSCADMIVGNRQGICPDGWHVSSAADWSTLISSIASETTTLGAQMKLNNTGFTNWDAISNNFGNATGFSGWPTGNLAVNTTTLLFNGWMNRGERVFFWVSEEDGDTTYKASDYCLYRAGKDLVNYHSEKTFGFSVRCVKD